MQLEGLRGRQSLLRVIEGKQLVKIRFRWRKEYGGIKKNAKSEARRAWTSSFELRLEAQTRRWPEYPKVRRWSEGPKVGGKKRNDVERGEDGFGELWDVNQEVRKDWEGLGTCK